MYLDYCIYLTLNAGEKVILLPPLDNPMISVVVLDDPRIFTSKSYQEPLKMVGMTGS